MSIRYRRNPQVEAAPMEEETILYLPEANRFCVLNRTAGAVWHWLEAPANEAELSALLRARYGSAAASLDAEVAALLDSMAELALVEADGAGTRAAAQHDGTEADHAPYAPPAVVVMSEEEILKAFQVTSAGITWWSM